ncbi:DUF4232 domain-containing protein [Pseudarthrobacter sp. NIBRBAC000502770]|uniref:DUF4232 domain-containing protein n=1 Tax=Pseudarthrobacter sp. NIBRBAC000502770 TaxID=2590785 RepID=UPI0011402957|nr:DUF4232 domain-containing protein [Pseudarthrobacter sp. NIBRBAC000502770]QDG87207.1 DUF4232 domain-containing protein [Pseudarthrobacter sp. NIBRBAC000502770]
MRSQKISQGFALTTAAAAAALLLTACGPSQPQSQTTTTPATGQASQSPTASASTPPPSSPAPATSTPASPVPATSAAGGPGLCKAAGLTAATDASGGGAAGSVYMKLNLTNKGSDPCILRGYPGVSLVAEATGAPIGSPAARDDSAGVVDVLLAPGQTGTAVLRYTQARNYQGCAAVDAAGYRIYPPEDTDSLFIPEPTTACSNADITLLSIGAFQPA